MTNGNGADLKSRAAADNGVFGGGDVRTQPCAVNFHPIISAKRTLDLSTGVVHLILCFVLFLDTDSWNFWFFNLN
jgi:hypothetical protein